MLKWKTTFPILPILTLTCKDEYPKASITQESNMMRELMSNS